MRFFYPLLLFLIPVFTFAQNPDQATIDKIVDEDSLITDGQSSDFVVRFDYYNKTLSAGRDLGIVQYSLLPSLTYNHKSGISASISSNYYSVSEPHYNMTDVNINYSNFFKFNDNWAYSISYDHYFFNPDSASVLTNNMGLGTSYNIGKIAINLNYGLSFGSSATGNSFNPGVSGFFEIKNVGFIDKIIFMPSVSASFGSSNITFRKFNANQFKEGHQGLAYMDAQNFKNSEFYQVLKDFRVFKKQNPDSTVTFGKFAITDTEAINDYKLRHPGATLYDYRQALNSVFKKNNNKEEFGLMSYNLSVPVRFKINKLTLGLTYNYVIPKLLPNDVEDELPNQSYFSAMISYRVGR